MGLEIQTGKVPGTEVRRTPAPRPPVVGLMILALSLLTLLFVGLVLYSLMPSLFHHPEANNAAAIDPQIKAHGIWVPFINEQTIISFWIGCSFVCVALMTLLWQRYFVDHVTIAKKRFRKWEDEGVQLHD